jgi:hypothetical protein
MPAARFEDASKEERAYIFAKMVEDCAVSAKERAPNDRIFTVADVTTAVSNAR